MIVFKTSKQHKKSAAEGGGLLRLFFCLLYNHFLRVQNEICTYWVYLMEHIFFELQLCIEILIFKEKSNFGYTDHPEISTSLLICSHSLNLPGPLLCLQWWVFAALETIFSLGFRFFDKVFDFGCIGSVDMVTSAIWIFQNQWNLKFWPVSPYIRLWMNPIASICLKNPFRLYRPYISGR